MLSLTSQKFSRSTVVLAVSISLWGTASAQVILFDDFESYADQAAFASTWTATAASIYALDSSFGNASTKSVSLPSPASGTTGRFWRNLGGQFSGSVSNPLVASWDFFIDPNGGPNYTGSRMYMELRSHAGGAFGSGALQQLVALGLFNTSDNTFNTTLFQGRVAFGSGNWNTLATGPVRSSGWHRMEVRDLSTQIEFYIDGQLGGTMARGAANGFDSIVIGSGLSDGSTPQTPFWIDNFRVAIVPEPASFLGLGLAASALIRRRRPRR